MKKKKNNTARTAPNFDNMPNKQNEGTISEAVTSRQSQLATLLIGILVVIAGFLTYNYFKQSQNGLVNKETQKEVSLENMDLGEIAESGDDMGILRGTYTVKQGDTLWKIALSQLGDGERWQEIAEANDIPIDNPEVEIGQELTIPGGAISEPTVEPTVEPTIEPTPETEEIVEELIEEVPETAVGPSTYMVKHGDTLWEIAQEIYGDGARWHEIFDANPLSMYSPDGYAFPLIHTGNILVIP